MSDEPVQQAERELADLERKGEQVRDDIEDVRRDWEQKKADPNVPGAGGNPQAREAGNQDRPETAYPAKGDDDALGKERP